MPEEKEIQLTDKQIQAIAERAAEVALNNVYKEVGKGVVKKLIWVIGAVAVGLMLWLGNSGNLPKGPLP